ncbi:hypothetical protein F2P79_023062 [Pimephales promelas]|nr:hypothetical protein F2P79_023062 [Pimephales promelas]
MTVKDLQLRSPSHMELGMESSADLEPVEREEPVERGEPLEWGEPVEPVEWREPVEPVERGEPVEWREPVEPVERGEPMERGEPADPGEPVEWREPVKWGKSVERGDPADPDSAYGSSPVDTDTEEGQTSSLSTSSLTLTYNEQLMHKEVTLPQPHSQCQRLNQYNAGHDCMINTPPSVHGGVVLIRMGGLACIYVDMVRKDARK